MSDNLIHKTFANCLILEKIGQGGMGIVYKAHHISLNKVVCVKILSKELEADPRNIEFFLREAEISKQLDHPNTIHVYDYGKEKDNYYIIMSYVEGKSLEDLVKEKNVLPVDMACDIMIGVFEGLEHAHSKNIIHRDIKPSNIIITKDGIPRIIDFGLARRVIEEKQLTITGEMIGTAYFMSPEQCLGKQVDKRADLYSTGATFFYILTGKYPFDGKSAIEVINKHVNEPLPNLFLIKPELPIWLVKMIEKLMRKNPEERYQSAKEVVEELKKYKEKDYKNVLNLDENEITLEEIAEKQELSSKDLSKTLRIKPEYEEVKEIGIDIEKEKTVLKREDQVLVDEKKKQIENENLVLNQNIKKFQPFSFHYLSKFVFHLFFSFFSFIFIMVFSTYISSHDLISLIKSNPSSIIFLLLSLIFIFLAQLKVKLHYPLSYFFLVILMFLTSFFTSSFETNILGIVDRVIYSIKTLSIRNENLFILSFFTLVSSAILFSYKDNIKTRIFSAILFFISLFLTGYSINYNIIGNFKLFYILIILGVISSLSIVFYFKRNFIILLFLLLSFLYLYIVKADYIDKNVDIRYQIELKKYEQEKEKIIESTREKFYLSLAETSSYDFGDVEKKLIEEIKKNLLTLKKPSKEEVKYLLQKEYISKALKYMFEIYRKNSFLSILIIWFTLNFIILLSILKKEEYES